jgi:outer membrane lipoprotein SlyB
MKKRGLVLMCIFVLSIITVCTGCTSTSQGSKTYTRSQAQSALTVYYGTVLNVADVKIQTETKGAVGGIAGGILGGVVGSTIGAGGGRRIATTVGALGGAAVGSKAEEKSKIKPGVELEVEFDDGRLMVIVQEKDDEYAVGDRIRVVEAQDGTLRVRQ